MDDFIADEDEEGDDAGLETMAVFSSVTPQAKAPHRRMSSARKSRGKRRIKGEGKRGVTELEDEKESCDDASAGSSPISSTNPSQKKKAK